ncbi:MAG: hypothetical protein P1V20_08510 [Verrucomicrobiales bacterium]|nr:hypothetical protein [Verrucomicrobiales bacterium]
MKYLLSFLIAAPSLLFAQEHLTGTIVPQVTAYDMTGKPVDFSERLKGHYSVVVFGCLT